MKVEDIPILEKLSVEEQNQIGGGRGKHRRFFVRLLKCINVENWLKLLLDRGGKSSKYVRLSKSYGKLGVG